MTAAINSAERRRSRRRPVLDRFAVFVVAQGKAPHRLPLRDVSDLGIGFQMDSDSGASELLGVAVGDSLDIQLYINQSLHIPLKIEVVRIYQQESEGPHLVGASIQELYSGGYKAFTSFIQLLDALADLHP